MIKDALSVLPARPVLYIVPVIVVLVLSFYYRDLYTKCSSIKQYRVALNELLHSMDASAQFRLVEFTDFSWDTVRIVANLKSGARSVECPFGWNWSSGERESVIASGLLTAMIFGREGAIVRYLELRSDEVSFRGADSSLTPETAVFSIAKNFDNGSEVTLTLNP